MEDNWDLHAVVRGCATIASTSSTTTTTTSSVSSSVFSTTTCSFQQNSASSSSSSSSSCGFFSMMNLPSSTSEQKSNQVFSFSNNSNNPFEARNSIDEELHELCKPFFIKSHPNTNFHHSFQTSSCSSSSSSSILSSSSFSYSSSPNSVQAQQKQSSSKHPHHAGSATTPRSKRRKNQLKKVCQVAAEDLSSDIWAWRKYGQKPIKGSPYPRGYYRCSSSKGCLARKQVEKSRTDPTMFIVTYTGEHNHTAPTHRNSLAGSTRQKPQTPQIAANEDTENKSLMMMTKQTSPSSISCVEKGEEEEEELALAQKSESELEDNMEEFLMMNDDDDNDNDEFGSPDMEIADDFFEGLDELTGSSFSAAASAIGECFGVASIPSLVAK